MPDNRLDADTTPFYKICRLLFLTGLLLSATLSGQQQSAEERHAGYIASPHETAEGDYLPVNRAAMLRSPAYYYSTSTFTAIQANVDSMGMNIIGDAANEPSIAVDPNDPNRIAIGWRQFDTITNSFRQAGYAYSADGGESWTFPGVIEPGIFRSDPVLDFDAEGNFYYNSLTVSGNDFWCDVFVSTDGGATWGGKAFGQGGDKQWMAIDRSDSMGHGHIYAFWSFSYSICPPGFFTRSTDGSVSYDACIAVLSDPFWGTLAAGPDGELYALGAGGSGFVIAKSTSAADSSGIVTWDFSTDVNLGGQIYAFGGSNSPNPSGLHGQAWVAVDHSDTESRGNVYALCSVEPPGADPLDVGFAKSTDGGVTFSDPVTINTDEGNNWQWFGTMSVAPNGRIDVVWLDTRNDMTGGVNSELFYSFSLDAGDTWSANEQLSESFDPHLGWPQQEKMGDYFDMVSHDDGAHLAWAGTFNGGQDVYYGFIQPEIPVAIDDEPVNELPGSFVLEQNYPNPFNPTTHVGFRTSDFGFVSIKVFDVQGALIKTLVSMNMVPGEHTAQWDGSNDSGQQVASGVYLYQMESGGTVQTQKMILLR